MSIHYRHKDRPYFKPCCNCAGCGKSSVPCSLSGVRYYCSDCFVYDADDYGSRAIASTSPAMENSDGNPKVIKGRRHVSGHRGY